MGNPGAQHELVCTLMQRYPLLALRLAEAAKVELPSHDLAVAGANSHQLRGRPPLDSDAAVRLLDGGKPVYFAQVEVQREHTLDKYATLRAYYGSEVSKAKTGGHMFVLSPRTSQAAAFRENEAELGEEFGYRGSYLSHEDLEFMAVEGRPFEERCLAMGMTDFSLEVPGCVRDMLREAAEHDMTIADLFFRTILEEVTDVTTVEGLLEPDILDKLRGLQAFRDYEERVEAAATAKAEAMAQAKAEAAAVNAEARAEARAEVKVEAAKLEAKADDLIDCFIERGDHPSAHAYQQVAACTDVRQMGSWLRRAFKGETSAEIFPEP